MGRGVGLSKFSLTISGLRHLFDMLVEMLRRRLDKEVGGSGEKLGIEI